MESKTTMKQKTLSYVVGVFALSMVAVLTACYSASLVKDNAPTTYLPRTAIAGGVEQSKIAAEYPSISPDGLKLIFVSDIAGSRDLWVADRDGSHMAVFLDWPGSDEKHPNWAPSGARIAFSSSRDATKHNIWTISAGGTDPVQLTSGNSEHEYPRFSPNGSQILYLSNSSGKKEIWIMNSDGSNQHPIGLITILVSDPAWSPDGQQIVYVGCRRAGPCNLFRINANGTNPFQITAGDFQDWNPDWSSAGIIFASNRGGAQGLWVIQPDGSGLRQVTSSEGAADLDPHWIPGANAFVFSRSGITPADSASDIWFAGGDQTEPMRITRLQSTLFVPLDIKPGSSPNSIGCSSNGDVPVAVFSTADFDARTIDVETVRFGKEGTESSEAHREKSGALRRHVEDVNQDGLPDLVFHFPLSQTGFSCSDLPVNATSVELHAKLKGKTFQGVAIEGEDVIRLVR